MTKITIKDVHRIAQLAKLQFEDNKAEELSDELSKVLEWIDQLNKIDTSNVTMSWEHLQITSSNMRPDIESDGNKTEDILKNAPDSEGEFFKVPKVIE